MDIEYRDWDSRFFGYPVGSIRFSSLSAFEMQLRQARQQAQALGLRLLYIETPPLNSHQRKIFQEAKANLVAINVEFIKTVSNNSPDAPNSGIQPCSKYHSALRALVLQSGKYSRFRSDPRFQSGVYERLYDEWLASSLRGDNRKLCLIDGPISLPRGLITVEPEAKARIGLLAVDSRWRGQGIGRRLVAEAERYCAASFHDILGVTTQKANQGACCFYERCGFHRVFEKEIFHVWFRPEENPRALP